MVNYEALNQMGGVVQFSEPIATSTTDAFKYFKDYELLSLFTVNKPECAAIINVVAYVDQNMTQPFTGTQIMWDIQQKHGVLNTAAAFQQLIFAQIWTVGDVPHMLPMNFSVSDGQGQQTQCTDNDFHIDINKLKNLTGGLEYVKFDLPVDTTQQAMAVDFDKYSQALAMNTNNMACMEGV